MLVPVVLSSLLATVAVVSHVAGSASATVPAATGGSFVPVQGRLYDSTSLLSGQPSVVVNQWSYAVKVAGATLTGSSATLPGLVSGSSPISALAVSITAVNYTGSGLVALAPDGIAAGGSTTGPSTSNLNFQNTAAGAVTNSAVVQVPTDGNIQFFVAGAGLPTAPPRLIIDVQGYYTAATSGTTPAGYVALTQTRIADTRGGSSAPSPNNIAPISTRTNGQTAVVSVPSSLVPSGATAIFANLTFIDSNVGDNLFASPYPDGGSATTGSSLNIQANAITATGAIIDINDTTGKFDIPITGAVGTGSTGVDILVDVEGYYSQWAPSGAFTPAATRVIDTRTPAAPITTGATRTVQVAGINGVPVSGSGISAVAVNVEVIATSPTGGTVNTGYVLAYSSDLTTAPSPASDVNFTAQPGTTTVRDSLVNVPLGADGAIKILNQGNSSIDVVLDVEGWYQGGQVIANGQIHSEKEVTLHATNVAANVTGVTYRYRIGTSGSFSDVPAAATVQVATTTVPSSWPQPVANSYVWDLSNTANGFGGTPTSDVLVQVEGCFSQAATPTPPAGTPTVCSPPQDMIYTASFDTSHAMSQVGPGTVSLQNGDYRVSATDVDVASYLGSLSISRSLTTAYPSPERAGTSGNVSMAGVFGQGWTAGVPQPDAGGADASVDDQSPTGFINLRYSSGKVETYQWTAPAGTYPSQFVPIGDAAANGSYLTFLNASTLTLTDADGTVTTWTGSTAAGWQPQSVTQPGTSGTTTSYVTAAYTNGTLSIPANKVVTRVIAATPTGLTCNDTNADATPGCRSLKFVYGFPPGSSALVRLIEIDLSAWDPNKSGGAGMAVIPVAKYDYYASGQLKDEYDPRLTNPLKTTYTYTSTAPSRLLTVTPPGIATANAWNFSYDSSGRVATVTRQDPTLSGSPTATTTIAYGIPITGTGAPYAWSPSRFGFFNQTDIPYTATAVFPPVYVPAATPTTTDLQHSTVTYIDPNGFASNTFTYSGGWHFDSKNYDANGNLLSSLTALNRENALTSTSGDPLADSQTTTSQASALLATVNTYDPLEPSELVDTLGPVHVSERADGSGTVEARDHTITTYDTGSPATAGQPKYKLPTSVVTDPYAYNATTSTWADVTAEARTTITGYAAIPGDSFTGWTLHKPTSVTVQAGASPSSSDLTTVTRYNSAGQVVEKRLPADTASASPGLTAGTTLTKYYTTGSTAACVNNAYAGLPCTTGPASGTGAGQLPTTTNSVFDVYDNVTTTADIGTDSGGTSITSTTTSTYDAAERPLTQQTINTGETAATAPLITETYDSTATNPFGVLLTKTTTVNSSVTQTLTSTYDALGRKSTYTDATAGLSQTAGITSTTTYDIAGRVATMNDGKYTTTYTYEAGTEYRGLVTSQTDSNNAVVGSTFTATYDADGKLVTQTYPNGLVATNISDPAGNQTGLTYTKSGSTWMSFSQAHGADGRVVTQTSTPASGTGTGSTQLYTYDFAGRLSRTDDITTGGVCTTRTYGFDKDSNRTSYASNTSSTSSCATGTATTNTFDAADRLTSDPAGTYTYDALGRTTTVPAADAANIGSRSTSVAAGNTTISYYDNDMVKTESESGTLLRYSLDPDRNRILTISDGTTNHYTGDSDDPAWATTAAGFTRYIHGIDGSLAATSTQTGSTDAVIDITNIQGSIVATAPDTTGATGITTGSFHETTEYGLPRVVTTLATAMAGALNPYGWLGEKQRSNDSLAGLTLMGLRLYNPTTGRFLTTDSVPGGNPNTYTYPLDPINNMDLTGEWGCGWCHKVAHFVKQHAKGIAQTAAFGACLVVSAGACIAAGIAAAVISNVSYSKGGLHANVVGFAIDTVTTLVGGGLGRAVAGSWTKSIFENYGRHVAADVGTAGARDWGQTLLNFGVNQSLGAFSLAGGAYAHNLFD